MGMMSRAINKIDAILNDLEDEDLTTEAHCDLDDLDEAITALKRAKAALYRGQAGKVGLASRNEHALVPAAEPGLFRIAREGDASLSE